MIRLTWTDPQGNPQASGDVPDLGEADRERRRLERSGCRSVKVLTNPHLFRERPSDEKAVR